MPYNISEFQHLKDKDILISMTGNVGRVSMNVGENNLLNQRVGLFEIVNSLFDREYIYYLLANKNFENAMNECGQGAAQLNISKDDIENYEIYVPCVKIN